MLSSYSEGELPGNVDIPFVSRDYTVSSYPRSLVLGLGSCWSDESRWTWLDGLWHCGTRLQENSTNGKIWQSFNDLYHSANQIGSTCLLNGKAGWATEGTCSQKYKAASADSCEVDERAWGWWYGQPTLQRTDVSRWLGLLELQESWKSHQCWILAISPRIFEQHTKHVMLAVYHNQHVIPNHRRDLMQSTSSQSALSVNEDVGAPLPVPIHMHLLVEG